MEKYPIPSEKAEELVNMFFKAKHQPYSYRDAQSCALIAVDEIIEQITHWCPVHILNYWMNVKKEIELS
jgi:hypothetical protein